MKVFRNTHVVKGSSKMERSIINAGSVLGSGVSQPANIRVGTHVSDSGVTAGAENIQAGGINGICADAYKRANLDYDLNSAIGQSSLVAIPSANRRLSARCYGVER